VSNRADQTAVSVRVLSWNNSTKWLRVFGNVGISQTGAPNKSNRRPISQPAPVDYSPVGGESNLYQEHLKSIHATPDAIRATGFSVVQFRRSMHRSKPFSRTRGFPKRCPFFSEMEDSGIRRRGFELKQPDAIFLWDVRTRKQIGQLQHLR